MSVANPLAALGDSHMSNIDRLAGVFVDDLQANRFAAVLIVEFEVG